MKYLILVMVMLMCTSFIPFGTHEKLLIAKPIIVTTKNETINLGLQRFMHDVAKRESNNKYWIVSKHGYLGKYQFRRKTLEGLGIFVSDSEFLTNESLQDSAMVLLLKKNNALLRDIIAKYNGSYYNGVYITRSGILAGSHLVGPGAVRAYFDTLCYCIPEDSNGTTVEDYISLFANYKFKLY